jgi:hypothetical protein
MRWFGPAVIIRMEEIVMCSYKCTKIKVYVVYEEISAQYFLVITCWMYVEYSMNWMD